MPDARYAIYFVPEHDSALYRFGASVLGYDCYSGTVVPTIESSPPDWPALTDEPRRYGFHATLKAPFNLRDGAAESELCRTADDFARSQSAIEAGDLVVREIGSFIALVPQSANAALNTLAADCVRGFDEFRAPLSAADRERRLKSRLSDRQIEQMDRWGYPYIFDDFRFHMTLTGPLAEPARRQALSFLRHEFEMVLREKDLAIRQIVVMKQPDRSARFKVLHPAVLAA